MKRKTLISRLRNCGVKAHLVFITPHKREEKNRRSAIKKHRVVRPNERIETFRSDITASNSLRSIILQSLLSPILQEAGTFFESSGKNVVRVVEQKNAFIAVLFFLRLGSRIQFFLPLWYLRLCSVVPFLSPHFFRSLFRFRASFSRMRLWILRVFHEFIFLLQELTSFYSLIGAQSV